MGLRRHYDWLVVGAGFTGSVIAHQLAKELNKRVLVIDRRPHIAGNAFDLEDANGVLYHQYGPHIFHTNSATVFNFLSRFTEWMPYEHRVVGLVDHRLIPVPFNLSSLQICFPRAEADELGRLLVEAYGLDVKVPILKMRQSGNPAVRDLAEFIYQKIFLNYTIKQWGLTPEQLSPAVTGRVPVNVSFDDRYFQDHFQFMPRHGYTALFRRLLDVEGITVGTSEDYFGLGSSISYDHAVFTGPIDAYFGYELGALPYRSLSFDFQSVRQARHQPVGTVNYPNDTAFTRITEQRYLTQQTLPDTVLTVEYPQAHQPGITEPYYPIPREENQALHQQYLAFAGKEAANVIFAGRLGDYQYYNMDQAVGHALSIFTKRILPLASARAQPVQS